MGDLGTFDGLRTTPVGQVLSTRGAVIDGLYAVGNDRASIMGGNYPGAGITLGPNMTFGWITGHHIAARRRRGRRSSAVQPERIAWPPTSRSSTTASTPSALRKMGEFIEVFDRLAMPILLRTLGAPLGFWTSQVGPAEPVRAPVGLRQPGRLRAALRGARHASRLPARTWRPRST